VKTSYLIPFLSVISLGAAGACDPADDTAAEPECDVRYKDADGDRKGDPSIPTTICAPGPGWVDNSKDCDDTNPYINEDEKEICDGIDNDCRDTTLEAQLCSDAGCTAEVNPETGTAYLFCRAKVGASEQQIKQRCGELGFSPAQVEDEAENDFLVEKAGPIRAKYDIAVVALGGFRSGGVWRWADGAQFWPDPRTGGDAPYVGWQASPILEDGEECVGLTETSDRDSWAPIQCEDAEVVVCERG
jgi:hypothetical protein